MVSLRYAGTALPAAGMCISPWVDLTCSGLSYQTRVAPRHRTLGLCSIFLLSVRSGVMATSREMLLTAGGGLRHASRDPAIGPHYPRLRRIGPRNRRPGHRDRGSTSRTDPDLRSLS